MNNILLIQFRLKEKAAHLEKLSILRELGGGANLIAISALDTEINWSKPELLLKNSSGVILGGSGDFDFDGGRSDTDEVKHASFALLDTLKPLLNYIFENDIPTLGICYGHQLIAAFAGAIVSHDCEQKKNGSHPVNLLVNKEEYVIFTDLPDSFYAHYVHKDSLTSLPPGAKVLISGGNCCQYSALCYKNHIFSTQFHPELTFEDMFLRIEAYPNYLPEGVTVPDIFKSDTNSNKILQNFVKFVAGTIKNTDLQIL